MATPKPLIFRGKQIGHMEVDEATGEIRGQLDPMCLTILEGVDLFWEDWAANYILEAR